MLRLQPWLKQYTLSDFGAVKPTGSESGGLVFLSKLPLHRITLVQAEEAEMMMKRPEGVPRMIIAYPKLSENAGERWEEDLVRESQLGPCLTALFSLLVLLPKK